MYLWSSLKRVPMVWQTSQPPAPAPGSLKYPESGTYGKNETKCWSITVPDTYAGILFRFFRYVFHFLRLSITCQLWGSELKLWLHFMLPLIIFLTNIVTAEKKTTWKMAFFQQFWEEAPDSWTTKHDWRRRKTISNYLCLNSYVTC